MFSTSRFEEMSVWDLWPAPHQLEDFQNRLCEPNCRLYCKMRQFYRFGRDHDVSLSYYHRT
jgi:hypothetical protein